MRIHIEGAEINTIDGDVIITLSRGTGKYSVNIIPLENKDD